jgi:hypothetical protein
MEGRRYQALPTTSSTQAATMHDDDGEGQDE